MNSKFKIFIMSGTHWDREWYQTFQGFRYRLVKMVDDMLEELEAHPELTFVFDGQTIVLEDYLEIAPENECRLRKFIEEERIVIGPWYCMPDEFIISGESLIRNLQIGNKLCRKFNTKPMKNGYICDIFGHAAQTPQIFAGFDIHNAVLGRGLNDHTVPAHFLWEAPDGTRCATFKLPDLLGYGDYYHHVIRIWNDLKTDEEKDTVIKEYIEKQFGRTDIPVMLFMDGLDHLHIHPDNVEIMERIRKLYPECEISVSSLDDFDAEINKYLDKMPVRRGELNEPAKTFADYIHLITNTVSSRHDIKFRNDNCQTVMEKWVLPITAMANLSGYKIRKSYGDLAYNYLIQNHPHDSICGCSIDQVHKDMIYRFDQTDEIAGEVVRDAVRTYRDRVHKKGEGKYILSVFNPLPYEIYESVTAKVTVKDFPFTRQEPFGYEKINNFKLIAADGSEVPYVIEKNIKETKVQDEFNAGDMVEISFMASLAPSGVTEYELVPQKEPVRYFASLITGQRTAENKYVAIEITPDGTVELTDKVTGKVFKNLLTFTDDAEIGDGWFNCTPVENEIYTSVGAPVYISVKVNGPSKCTFKVVKEMKLPKKISRFDREMPRISRSEELETMVITSYITLENDMRFVKVSTFVNNNIKDHRLKVNFETGMNGNYFASEPFCVLNRKCGRTEETQNWKECEPVEKAFSGIIGKREENCGLAIVSAGGVHECAGLDDKNGTLAVTLLRAFEKTVNTDFETDGEIQGIHEYSFAIVPLDNSVCNTDLFRLQDRLAAGVKSVLTECDAEEKPENYSFMMSDNFCVSAIKLPEDEEADTIIVRVFNPEPLTGWGSLYFNRGAVKAQRVNMNEEFIEDIEVNDGEIMIELDPWKIETYRITLK